MNIRIFSASLICAALLGLPAFAQSVTVSAGTPGPGTDAALKCLLRQGPADCQTMFVGAAMTAARSWVWDNPTRDFRRGDLQSSGYFGPAVPENVFDKNILIRATSADMDIFDVKFAHVEYSVYISPADADGKIRDVAIRLYAPHDLSQLGG